MKIVEHPLAEIKPYHKNAKDHSNKQIKKIANSIKEFGFNQPIVIDKENVIIVGHGRYLAAVALGLEVAPTLMVDLNEERAKAYRLADNKLNESDWEREIVLEELKSLSLEMLDLTGFNENLVLETKEDNLDLKSVSIPQSQRGDLYELGPHKILCGDATDENDWKKLMQHELARLIFTDPPYSVDYHLVSYLKKDDFGRFTGDTGASYHSERFGGTGGHIFNDDKTPAEALKFYTEILNNLYKFSTDDTTIYWWFANRLTDINMQAFSAANWHFSQIIIWLKNSMIFSPGQLYHRIYEPCMVGWKSNKTHYQDYTFSTYTELWDLDQKTFAEHLDIIYSKRDNTAKYTHPTQKPVRLSERALKHSSEKDDIVVDAFGGSGSTMIGCDQLNRRARLLELDPKYVDAIVSRWCQYKDDPRIVKNGKEIQWHV